jgi:hypothetical protein
MTSKRRQQILVGFAILSIASLVISSLSSLLTLLR